MNCREAKNVILGVTTLSEEYDQTKRELFEALAVIPGDRFINGVNLWRCKAIQGTLIHLRMVGHDWGTQLPLHEVWEKLNYRDLKRHSSELPPDIRRLKAISV